MLRSSLLSVVAIAVFAVPVQAAADPISLDPLLRSAAERVATSDLVAAAKWGTDQPIEDPAREQQVLDTVAARSVELGIDPQRSREIFRDQIEASKLVQRGLYEYWTAHPGEQPTERPDLGQIRPVIDRLNEEILLELRDSSELRAHASCPGQVTAAYHRTSTGLNLDPLHRTGLARTLPALCD